MVYWQEELRLPFVFTLRLISFQKCVRVWLLRWYCYFQRKHRHISVDGLANTHTLICLCNYIRIWLSKPMHNPAFTNDVPCNRTSHACSLYSNIYTSISIASISFTGRMKFIPRWTPLASSPRKGTEITNDVRNFPLFLECCYFKIASTRCKAILIASPNKFRISQYRHRLLLFTIFYSLIKKRLLKSITRLKKGHNRRKTNKF